MEWFRDFLQVITVILLLNIYYIVKNIRKVQSGGIGDDTMNEFASEILKGTQELEKEKRQKGGSQK